MIFSTKDVHPRERLSYWIEVASRGYVDHDTRPLDRASFDASVRISSLAGLGLSAFEADAHQVDPAGRSSDEDGDLLLSALLSGEICIGQDGRQAVIKGPGLYLVDPARPFELVLREHCRHVIVKIPRAMLEARIGTPADLTGREHHAASGVGALAIGMIALLPEQAELLGSLAGMKVAEQLLDLTALALTAGREHKTAISSPRATTLLRLKAAVERLLLEPELKPEQVAAEAGISVRYANALLGEEHTSLERYVAERRLERCRAAFDDATQSHRTISEIAFSWGFSDLSHFGRRFKARYGLTPTDYRRRAAEIATENAKGPAGPPRHLHAGEIA